MSYADKNLWGRRREGQRRTGHNGIGLRLPNTSSQGGVCLRRGARQWHARGECSGSALGAVLWRCRCSTKAGLGRRLRGRAASDPRHVKGGGGGCHCVCCAVLCVSMRRWFRGSAALGPSASCRCRDPSAICKLCGCPTSSIQTEASDRREGPPSAAPFLAPPEPHPMPPEKENDALWGAPTTFLSRKNQTKRKISGVTNFWGLKAGPNRRRTNETWPLTASGWPVTADNRLVSGSGASVFLHRKDKKKVRVSVRDVLVAPAAALAALLYPEVVRCHQGTHEGVREGGRAEWEGGKGRGCATEEGRRRGRQGPGRCAAAARDTSSNGAPICRPERLPDAGRPRAAGCSARTYPGTA